jgi:hypothetical protein
MRKETVMSDAVDDEDWKALMEVLEGTTSLMGRKQVEPVKLGILEFSSTTAMLGLEDLAGVGSRFESFLLEKVAPDWDEEAAATLNFAMGALIEKMQTQEYGPAFSAGLDEVLLYLSFFDEEEKEGPMEAPDQALPTFQDEIELPDGIPLAAEAPQPVSQASIEEIHSMPQAPVDTPEVSEVSEVSEVFEGPPSLSIAESAYDTESRAPLFEATPTPGFISDGVAWYTEMLKHDPASRVFVSLAEELCSRELWKEAVETCRRGLVFHPHMIRARVLLGWALWKSEEVEEAEQVLTEARKEVEKNSILYQALAEIADSKGDPEQAAHLLDTYRAFQSAGGRRPPAVAAERKASTAQCRQIGGASASVPAFLTALLRRFEQKPVRTVPPSTVFSKEDREALKELLRGETLH